MNQSWSNDPTKLLWGWWIQYQQIRNLYFRSSLYVTKESHRAHIRATTSWFLLCADTSKYISNQIPKHGPEGTLNPTPYLPTELSKVISSPSCCRPVMFWRWWQTGLEYEGRTDHGECVPHETEWSFFWRGAQIPTRSPHGNFALWSCWNLDEQISHFAMLLLLCSISVHSGSNGINELADQLLYPPLCWGMLLL